MTLTESEANQVRIILRHTTGWDELCDAFPNVAKAIEKLPDCSFLRKVNMEIRAILYDAIVRVKGRKAEGE